LSLNKNNLYHGTKSNILQGIESTELPGSAPSSAIIIELSAIMRCPFDAKIFDDFAVKVYNHILGMAEGNNRIDVICDRYFETSHKNLTRKDRGCGATLNFEEHIDFPRDFKDDFMKNPKNKERLYGFNFIMVTKLWLLQMLTVFNQRQCVRVRPVVQLVLTRIS